MKKLASLLIAASLAFGASANQNQSYKLITVSTYLNFYLLNLNACEDYHPETRQSAYEAEASLYPYFKKLDKQVTKQITKETLVGSKIFRQMPTPSGGMVVLVGLDADTVSKVSEQALKTSMKNERALWQKFQAEKSFDELANEIANIE